MIQEPLLRMRITALLLGSILSFGVGCSSYSLNIFRGPTKVHIPIEWHQPKESFSILIRNLAASGYNLVSYSPELLIAEFRKDVGVNVPREVVRQLTSPMAEPYGFGYGVIGGFGRQTWVRIRIAAQLSERSQPGLEVTTEFFAQEDAATIYPLNSTGTFEAKLTVEIERNQLIDPPVSGTKPRGRDAL